MIRSSIRYLKKNILTVLAVFGPGIITAFADNDAGGVATYSVAAANFGYMALTLLIPITLVLAITQEIGARIAIVTGKGLADLIRERFGIRVTLTVFGGLFLVNYVVILQNMSGMKSALQLFNLPYLLFLPLLLTGLFLLIIKANYQKIQNFFFVIIFFYIAYVISAFLARPDWGKAVESLFIPKGTVTFSYLFTSIAVLGTTVTAWGQFFINSYVKDKKLKIEDLPYSQIEIVVGAFLTNLFTFFMMIAVIATLYTNNLPIQGADDAAMSMRPLAGSLASALFGFGLLVAGFLGLAIVPLTTAYAFSEFFGYQGTLNDDFQKSKLFYGFFLLQILLGALVVFIPSFSLFKITLAASFINGMILPIIFYFLYKIANSDELMGKHKNSFIQNVLLVGSAILISFGTLLGGVGQLLGW